ncbi:hypothetical protein NL676_018187 [Syzygium grande]|nr:hypothetical protein NL676_018187 [Syzygium grande]
MPCGKRDPRCLRRPAMPASGSAASLGSGLVSRIPSRRRRSIFYKFSSDYVLRKQNRNPWNEIRMGKPVEDLDAFARTICYKLKFLGLNDGPMVATWF